MKQNQANPSALPDDGNCKVFLYRPDAKSPAPVTETEEAPQKSEPKRSELLAHRFEGLLENDALVSEAMVRLSPFPKFGALVIRLDPFDSDNAPLEGGTQNRLADILQAACRERNGIWGRLEPDLFAALFPDLNSQSAFELAKQIQQQFAPYTASIGVAAYPCINFARSAIVENSRKALDHAAFFGPGSAVAFDAVSLNISADQHYQRHDLAGAVEEFRLALMLDPSNVNVHNSLGVCYAELGDLEKAAAGFETALWLDPQEVMARYNAGLVQMMKGNPDEALAAFLEAHTLDPQIFEVELQAGRIYLELQKPAEALPFLERAVNIRPEAGAGHAALGQAYMALEKPDAAFTAYQKAVKLSPNNAASLSALGSLLESRNESLEIASTFCEHSVEIEPDNGLFHYRLGRVYLKQNRPEDALKSFLEAQRLGHDAEEPVKTLQARIENATDPA